MLRSASLHLASLLVLLACAFFWLPERQGLRCRFGISPADGAAPPQPTAARPGLLRIDHAGLRFARPRGSGVDPQVRSWWAAGKLKDASLRWTGWVYVPSSDSWSFATCSDDDSAVLVDDRLVSVNWGQHSPRTHWGRARLERGWHRLRVDYVQIDGAGVVELLWKGPGGPVATIPREFLARDRGPEDWLGSAWAALSGDPREVQPHLDRVTPWHRDTQASPLEAAPSGATPAPAPPLDAAALGRVPYPPARWQWVDLWGGTGPDSVVAAGTGEPAPCAGLDAAGMLPGGWRIWRTRVRVPWTTRVRLEYPHAAPAVLWVGGATVMGTPAAPAIGPQTVVRTLPAGVTEVLLATAPCVTYPPLELAPLSEGGEAVPALVPVPPERRPWPAPLEQDARGRTAPGWGAASVRQRVEPLLEEIHERVWFHTDTRLQAPYLYRWDAKRWGHPASIAPLIATWEGELEVPARGTWTLHVKSSGRAWLDVGGRTLYKDAAAAEARLKVELPPGWHPLRLDAHDPGVVRTISLSWTAPGATEPVLVPPAALRPAGGPARIALLGGVEASRAGLASLAIALVLALFTGGPRGYARFLCRRWVWHAWIALIAVGLVVRLHDYAYVPAPGDTDDELTYHMVGTSLVQGLTPVGWAWMAPFPVVQLIPLHGRVFRIVAPMVAYPPLYSFLVGLVHHAAGATSAFEARLHVTRLLPIGLSILSLAMVAPLARALGMRPSAGLLATAFLAVYPQAVIQNRLIKEENLLAPLLMAALWLVVRYRRRSGPVSRWAMAALIVAAILAKPMGLAVAVVAVAGLAARGHRNAAVHAGLAAVLGIASFAWYGFAWAGEAYLWQMRMFAGYAERLDVMTPLALNNTITGYSAPAGWLVGLWIVCGTTLLSLKAGRRRYLGLTVAAYALITAAAYPAQLNWGWYKIPLWPLFALAWGHQARRLLRRADPLLALVFVGLFLLPTLEVLGGPIAAWPEATQVSSLLGFLSGGSPTGWVSPRLLLRVVLALTVCPALLVAALPRPLRRWAASAVGGAILVGILGSMLWLAWYWGLVYPAPMAGDPWGVYENPP